jgi:DNA-binding SARP family transcriptional activator/tetratricopeptide (TPR) repeat protein
MRVALLGPLDITADDGTAVDLAGHKPRRLMAVLACHANRPVRADLLVEALWGPNPPRRADASLRVYVHHLRKALGSDRIGRRAEGYLLSLGPGELDVDRFRALVAEADRAVATQSLERAEELLTAALALWRGPALAGLESVPVLAVDAAGLEELRLQTLEQRFEVALALQRFDGIVAELRALTDRHPLRETLRGQLMRALMGAGRGAEAMEVFEATRRALADELGLDPGPRLRDLHLALLRDDPALRPALVTPVKPDRRTPAPRTVPRQLPAGVAGFAGRARWLARLDALLAAGDEGALTVAVISGTGGIGKTALAVHWAHTVADRFPDGQVFIDLAGFDPVRPPVDPAAALSMLLTALGVAPSDVRAGLAERESQYRSILADRRVLVVLDNAHDAAQVRSLLPGGAGCLVLVTSRNLLTGLVAAGASALGIDLLDPAEACDLLEHRLGPARVAAEPVAVEEILARCDGLPLALSVVAARAAVMADSSLSALAADLRRSRRALDGLSGDDATTDPRAVFSCSYRVLETATARLFRLLSVHPGPDITVRAAASIAGVPVAEARVQLRRLHAASLLLEVGPGRFRYHDLLRAYALELAERVDSAPERAAALRRFLDHLVHTAYPATLLIDANQTQTAIDAAEPGVTPDPVEDRQQALAWFEAERAVVLAAVERAGDGFASHAWQLACSAVVYLDRSGHWHDKLAVLSAARDAARQTGEGAVEARTLRSLARTQGRLHRYEEAYANLRAAVTLYRDLGDVRGMAFTCGAYGEILEHAGRYEEALAMDEEALELYRRAGSVIGQARSLGGIASVQALLGRHEQTIATCRRALELFEQVGDRTGSAGVYDTLGVAYQRLGLHDEAVACFRRALVALRETGARFYLALVLRHLGEAQQVAGEAAEARRSFERALAIFAGLGAREAAGVRDQLAALTRATSTP